MILAVSIVASTVIARLRGGRFSALGSLSVRWSALAVAAFMVQALFIYRTPVRKTVGVWGWEESLFLGQSWSGSWGREWCSCSRLETEASTHMPICCGAFRRSCSSAPDVVIFWVNQSTHVV